MAEIIHIPKKKVIIKKSKKDVEENKNPIIIDDEYKNYEKKEEIEHILDLSEMYIGSKQVADYDKTVNYYFLKNDKISTKKDMVFIPGLYKIFDESLINSSDNCIRTMNEKGIDRASYVKVNISKNSFIIENDGKSIPIVIHPDENIYVPEMIFSNLRTSGNYKKDERRIVGGLNGLGVKLVSIFATKTNIQIHDKKRNKKYLQSFTNNMRIKSIPEITELSETETNMVKLECFPDFSRFENSTEFSDDMMSYLSRRVYDIAATIPKHVSVYLNDKKIDINHFKSYVKMYEPDVQEDQFYYIKPHERWEIILVKTDKEFRQVSFVNNIHTYKGGKHVNYVMSKIKDHLFPIIKKKSPQAKKDYIDNYVHIYINCFIENPKFDSQTKENMTSKVEDFGSKFDFDKEFLKNLEKCGIIEEVIEFSEFKVNKEAKKTDGKKTAVLKQKAKLHDAPNAGKRTLSSKCVLILTEGLSASALALSGLSKEQRQFYGIYALKGKVLNVRDETKSKILSNDEINDIKVILGLSQDQVVTDISELRYGAIRYMTDQDVDGYHIKGLLMNLFDVMWDSLYKFKNFFGSIRTPLLKTTFGKRTESFYTDASYKKWFNELSESEQSRWKTKYYKGLGTSTDKEAKEYFRNLEQNTVYYNCDNEEQLKISKEKLDNIFNSKKTDIRKEWLSHYQEDLEITYNEKNETNYTDFFDKEFIHFSNSDNIRSIPSINDGFKTGQRKIFFGLDKKKIKETMKISVAAGAITELAGYHHGEKSIYDTMVKMAQIFIGSNNINYLIPDGQFGTRINGGKDAASARYISTNINPLMYYIYREEDNPILDYTITDNKETEPCCYYPIIPMILVNGSEGIGTGYSTYVPSYNPIDIINNIKLLLTGKKDAEMIPYFDGFTGKVKKVENKKKITKFDENGNPIEKVITKSDNNSYITCGNYTFDNDSIKITEIPVGIWIADYKKHIDSLVITDKVKSKEKKEKKNGVNVKKNKKTDVDEDKQFINHYDEVCTPFTVDITIYSDWDKIHKYIQNGDLEKILKLQTKISTTNMVLFDNNKKLVRYKDTSSILNDFCKTRLVKYQERIDYQINSIKEELIKINSKIRFIIYIMDETLVIFKKPKDEVEKELVQLKFIKVDDSYDYLLTMQINSFTKEKLDKMNEKKNEKEQYLMELESTTNKQLWTKELDELLVEYEKYSVNKKKEIADLIKEDSKEKKKGKK